MKLNERHLIQLSAVVDAGGVSEGAALLGMTQSAVSRSLSMLEARIGEPLFVPGRRPLQPTALGSQLAIHGRAILAASRRATDAVQGHLKGTSGVVRVGGVPFFMDALISQMLAEFHREEPEVSVQQSYGNLPDLVSGLSAGLIDLGIVPVGSTHPGPQFEFTELLRGRNIVACRVGHPLLRRRLLKANDLSAYPWIAPLPGSPLLSDLQMILMSIGVPELHIRYSGGSLMSVVNFLADSDALAVLPFSVLFAMRKDNRVAVVPFAIPQPDRNLGILRLVDAPRAPATDRLVLHLVAVFDTLRHVIRRHEDALVWSA
ncbi:DNA-binding transcriptional regulator, LysR family [Devosia enhydra]|uniref:DNA-binding transcriptional regulator, LysR family n=1 Tax=Devosia enhydra TaxID=665118 RepID=A0A1K2I3B4_9HYPH|nr:LysR family transcriptional regulator [Devosia enhydra]SFZ86869.1 DNA-binding transcriptional regulator, LysR family [Devosia enhydra]